MPARSKIVIDGKEVDGTIDSITIESKLDYKDCTKEGYLGSLYADVFGRYTKGFEMINRRRFMSDLAAPFNGSFYIVVRENHPIPSDPAVHFSELEAESESKRLARENPGVGFFVMQAVKRTQSVDTQVIDLRSKNA